MEAVRKTNFPLFSKAERTGVFSGEKGYLISAPTATGKSRIGREIIRRNLVSKPATEVFLYLVPFKALAEETYLNFRSELPNNVRLNIKTGDYDTPFELKETDVLVATYESVDGIIQEGRDFYPTLVVADEFSIIADHQRGAKIESLISYLARRPGTKLYALSAVLSNPAKIAKWLGISVLKGNKDDRPVPLRVECILFREKEATVEKVVKEALQGGSVIIFCETKKNAVTLCSGLSDLVSSSMSKKDSSACKEFSIRLKSLFPYLVDLPELVESGIAFHHANLEVDLRNEISKGFLDGKIKVLVATTTLSAGVNLPARVVIVRDVTRHEGFRRLLPVSEMINMLGRAGRPNLNEEGIGYFLVDREKATDERYKNFINRVKEDQVEEVESQIPRSPTNRFQFILSAAARMGGISRDDLLEVYNESLWGLENPLKPPIPAEREFTKQVENFLQPQDKVRIRTETAAVTGDTLTAKGGTGDYDISISPTMSTCTCKSFTVGGKRPCKHIKQLQFQAVKGEIGKKIPEASPIATDSLKEATLQHPMYLLATGIRTLLEYGFLEERDGKLFVTQDGKQAQVNYLLSIGHVRVLRDRIKNGVKAEDETDVIRWAVEDFKEPKPNDDEGNGKGGRLDSMLESALWEHIEGKKYKEILTLGQNGIQKFLNAKDLLDQIFNVYHAFCSNDDPSLASLVRTAKRRVHYGSTREALPLLVLELDEIDAHEKAVTLIENGIFDAKGLSRSSASELSQMLTITLQEAKRLVERAVSICNLVEGFSTQRGSLNTLASRTGIKIDALLDFLIPEKVASKISSKL
jgi:superfamily II DNA or RNA helicase